MSRRLNGIVRLLVLACCLAGGLRGRALDLRSALVVSAPDLSARERKAVQMLVEEAGKRTGIVWQQTNGWPTGQPVIYVGRQGSSGAVPEAYARQLQALPTSTAGEGYRLCVLQGQPGGAVFVIGNDSRGVLFGVGRLLREMQMQRGRVVIEDALNVTTAPKYPLRGHQLGYRPKCNSYDAWDLPVWEQYFRDLAVFGCNTIELIPPRSDDDLDSPHFPRPPIEMMAGMSRVADAYGLDVWVWYPAMDKDYSDPKTVEAALEEWGQVFARLSRLDAVFVPGGDPGHTQPKVLMALLEKQTRNLHRYHPKAQMWVSPQGFTQPWLEEFIDILKREQPAWLSGVVYGPQVRVSIGKLRELVPARYPLRHYPDITHSRQCQFPVPNWDVAYALTEGRECINPRPVDEANTFHKTQPGTIGFLTYSEGCNDDVNKAIWSALGWDPGVDLTNVLRQFSRYFVGERYGGPLALGLMDLERNWRGPLVKNTRVERTLGRFQSMEKVATPAELKNWRFQQALFRAYYDAYTQRRLVYERGVEAEAMKALRQAGTMGTAKAMAAAREILARASQRPIEPALRTRIYQLAEALFQSIGMQLSVPLYQAIGVDRGASLDTLDYPLNNRRWLEGQFSRIGRLPTEAERLAALQKVVDWTYAGAGGFYDDFGNSAEQPHLVPGLGFSEDPECFHSPRVDFEEDAVVDDPEDESGAARRVSWMDHVESLYDGAVHAEYQGLDPNARYKLRVVYAGDSFKKQIRLVANEGIEIHPYLTRPKPIAPLEFDLPAAATSSGTLRLSWFGEQGLGGNGRNAQVSEVWLLKQRP